MSLKKFSNVSSKSHMLGNKENLPQSKQAIKFFHFVVHCGLFIMLRVSYHIFVKHFKYICLRHSQTGITIGFEFLGQKLYIGLKIQGNILLLSSVEVWSEYPKQNMESLRTKEHNFFFYSSGSTIFPKFPKLLPKI